MQTSHLRALGVVYISLFGKSTVSEDAHFNNFKSNWQDIDKSLNLKQLELSFEWLKERSAVVIKELKALINDEKAANKAILISDNYR